MNQYGLDETIWKQILDTCFSFPEVNKVILFGSRARKDYRQGSDIDIAIDAPGMMSSAFSQVWNAVDDLPIIYTLDIAHLQSLTNEPLVKAIHEDGVEFIRDDSTRIQ